AARAAQTEKAHDAFSASEAVVWFMFDRLEHRDVEGYVAGMSDDFRFDSNDAGFSAAWPAGMSRNDEQAFATHLFQGMPARVDRPASPAVAYVLETIGPLHVSLRALENGLVSGVIENYRILLVF